MGRGQRVVEPGFQSHAIIHAGAGVQALTKEHFKTVRFWTRTTWVAIVSRKRRDGRKNKRCRSSETKSDKKERDSDRKHKSHKSSSTKGVFSGSPSDHCTDELEMDTEDLAVLFYPDHMVYGDSYCTNCVLTFTSTCIKIEGSGSTLDGDDKILKLQWDVQDLVHIKSHWYELVEMAMVTIHVLTEDTVQPENVEYTSGAELKFAIMGTNWFGKQEAITTLNVAYKTLRSSMLELEDTILGQIKAPFTKYFPNFDQTFEEVLYPKWDVDAVSIINRDIDLLLPDTFVNDTIIDFYVKYLKNKIRPEERQRFHFFNSFFFRKLADPEKEPLNALEGKTAFQRVIKWTRKVNLFEKDFVFIPVNYNLIVMCHLGEVAKYKDEEDVTELIKVPCVLHMDPIRGSHTVLKGLMQSYLKEEWKGRQQEASEDISSRFDNLRFISLELPQQPNSFDCGLFLLHYVEHFLEQAPINFNPFRITKSVHFLNTDWFPPADASLKRVVIQRLVYDLLQQPYDEAEAFYKVFSQPVEEVIYPKEDVDDVSISKRDVDFLLPNTFVNDTIIDFYVKYLKNKISKMKPLDLNLAALSAKCSKDLELNLLCHY
ncbi:unnamed protein product [Lactuca saligna]|uniref:Ubiquitin-like protease family profile domain-containing protein n=1 Tax=Lactuca saligna TaxID=75948 RepID=A0AA35VEE9_LACSI|nr:unnamed protein product [Lactuca saligna]